MDEKEKVLAFLGANHKIILLKNLK